MTDTTTRTTPAPVPERGTRRRPQATGGLFRAFWRWHFYASFLVVPVLLVLATTGLIYLFRFQLEPLLTPDLLTGPAAAGSIAQPYAAQLAAVEREFRDATVLSMAEPRRRADRPCSPSSPPRARVATSTSTRTAPRCSAPRTRTGRCPGRRCGCTPT